MGPGGGGLKKGSTTRIETISLFTRIFRQRAGKTRAQDKSVYLGVYVHIIGA